MCRPNIYGVQLHTLRSLKHNMTIPDVRKRPRAIPGTSHAQMYIISKHTSLRNVQCFLTLGIFVHLLKLLTPSHSSMLDHGHVHSYDRIYFSMASHVLNESQEWIRPFATLTGWFSVLRSQNTQSLHATHEYRRCSVYLTISWWRNPMSTELFNTENSTEDCAFCFYVFTIQSYHTTQESYLSVFPNQNIIQN